MAINATPVGVSSNTAGGVAAFSTANPGGLALGDWLVAVLIHRNGTNVAGVTSDNGFTLLGTRIDVATYMSAWLWVKKVTQADIDAASYGWTMDTTGAVTTTAYALTLTAWRGPNAVNAYSSITTEVENTTLGRKPWSP